MWLVKFEDVVLKLREYDRTLNLGCDLCHREVLLFLDIYLAFNKDHNQLLMITRHLTTRIHLSCLILKYRD